MNEKIQKILPRINYYSHRLQEEKGRRQLIDNHQNPALKNILSPPHRLDNAHNVRAHDVQVELKQRQAGFIST